MEAPIIFFGLLLCLRLLHFVGIDMRQRDRQRIGRVVGFGCAGQLKQQRHHILHLFFVGLTVPSNGLFDL